MHWTYCTKTNQIKPGQGISQPSRDFTTNNFGQFFAWCLFLGGLVGAAGQLSQSSTSRQKLPPIQFLSLMALPLQFSSHRCISLTFQPPFSLFIFSLSFRRPIPLFTANLLPTLFLYLLTFFCSFLPSLFFHLSSFFIPFPFFPFFFSFLLLLSFVLPQRP